MTSTCVNSPNRVCAFVEHVMLGKKLNTQARHKSRGVWMMMQSERGLVPDGLHNHASTSRVQFVRTP